MIGVDGRVFRIRRPRWSRKFYSSHCTPLFGFECLLRSIGIFHVDIDNFVHHGDVTQGICAIAKFLQRTLPLRHRSKEPVEHFVWEANCNEVQGRHHTLEAQRGAYQKSIKFALSTLITIFVITPRLMSMNCGDFATQIFDH